MSGELEAVRTQARAICESFTPPVELTDVTEPLKGVYHAFICVGPPSGMPEAEFWDLVRAIVERLRRDARIEKVYLEVPSDDR